MSMLKKQMPISEVFRQRFLASAANGASYVIGMNPGPFYGSALIGTSFYVRNEDDATGASKVTLSSSYFVNPAKITVAELVVAINAELAKGSGNNDVASGAVASAYTTDTDNGKTYIKIAASAQDKNLTITRDTAPTAKDALPLLGILPVVIEATEFKVTWDLSSYFQEDFGMGAVFCPPIIQVNLTSSEEDVQTVPATTVKWCNEQHASTPFRVIIDHSAVMDGIVTVLFV